MCNGKTHTKVLTAIKPYDKRSCTDVLFLLLFLGGWAATVYVTERAVSAGGNPQRIIRGVDLYGRICGRDEGVEDLELAAWPHPEHNVKICVASCDETETHENISFHHHSTEFIGLYCVPALNGSVSIEFSGDFQSGQQTFTRSLADLKTTWPIIAGSAGVALLFSFLYMFVVRRFASTLVWVCVLGMTVAGAALSYVLLQKAKDDEDPDLDDDRRKMLQGAGYAFAALTVVFVLVVIGMRQRIRIAVAVMKEASRAIMHMPGLVAFPVAPLALALGMVGLWIVASLYTYSVADRDTAATPDDVTEDTDNPSTMVVYRRDESFNNSLVWLFFHLLWVLIFILYFAFSVIAGAVADDFFQPRDRADKPLTGEAHPGAVAAKVAPSPQLAAPAEAGTRAATPINAWGVETAKTAAKATAKTAAKAAGGPVASAALSAAGVEAAPEPHKRSKRPVCASLCRTLRFHTGTVAFGSLILSVINFARVAVRYLEEVSKSDNGCIKAIYCAIQCCLSCLHCIADKISKNAFIWNAVYGDNFLDSAYGSFNLIWAHLAKFAAVSVVSSYIMLLGKLVVALLTTGVAAAVLTQTSYYKDSISSPVIPCVVVFILAYCVCSLFLVVYGASIDTIFLCFLIDFDVNKGGNMLSPPSLQKLVGEFEEDSKVQAMHMAQLRSSPAVAAVGDATDKAKSTVMAH